MLTRRRCVAPPLSFRRFAALVALLQSGVLGLAERAQAEPAPSEHIELVYQAPAECPADDAFRAEVRGRVTSDWEARPGELARRIAVSVVVRDGRYVAAIEFLNPQGERVTRSVAGKACPDVVNGIALVTALAIQSRVEEALAQSDPEGSAPPPPPPPEPPKPELPKKAAPSAPVPAPPRPRESPPARRAHVRLGGAGAVSTGVGPNPTIGPAFFAAIEWDGPRLGVTGTAFWSGSVQAGGVPVRFRRLAARLEGCPGSWGFGNVAFEPCGYFEVGSLRGDGESNPPLVVKPTGGGSLWLAPGAIARLVTSFEPLVIELEASAGVPLVQQQFGVLTGGREESKFDVPLVVLGGALGLGVRL